MNLMSLLIKRTAVAAIFIFPATVLLAQSAKTQLAENRVVLVTDFDRTLTGPAWNSIWVLKKIPSVNNYNQTYTNTPQGVISFDQLPNEVSLTETEFITLFKNKLAVHERSGHYTVRSRDAALLPALPHIGREKPVTFLPGYYVVTTDSFKYYRSNPEENYLLTDNETARANASQRLPRFGISFPLFQLLTATLPGVANIHIPTARGQSQEEFVDGLFAQWKAEGWIENIYGEEYVTRQGSAREPIRIYPLGRGESVLFGDHLTEKKLRVVRDEIITHYRLQALQQKAKFLIVFAEDNPEIIQEYHRMLLEYSAISNYRDTLDFMLVHAGSDEEVRRSEMPDRYTVYQNGLAQKASADLVETFFPQKPSRKAMSAPASGRLTCRNLFLKGA